MRRRVSPEDHRGQRRRRPVDHRLPPLATTLFLIILLIKFIISELLN
jgi:hypothetical protein